MLFCCILRNVETCCHKHFVVVSDHQQTPSVTTSDKCTQLATARRHRVDNTWPRECWLRVVLVLRVSVLVLKHIFLNLVLVLSVDVLASVLKIY